MTQKTTEENTMARVIMVSSQSPSRPINTRVATVNPASLIPDARQAIIPRTTIKIRGGDCQQTVLHPRKCNIYRPFDCLKKPAISLNQPVDELVYPFI